MLSRKKTNQCPQKWEWGKNLQYGQSVSSLDESERCRHIAMQRGNNSDRTVSLES